MRSSKRRLLSGLAAISLLFVAAFTFMPQQAAADHTPGHTTQTQAPVGVDCSGVKKFNPLKWVVCPVVTGLTDLVDVLDKFINTQMTVGTPGQSSDPNQIFCNSQSGKKTATNAGEAHDLDSCAAYYKAWSSIRNIALGLMVVVGLIVLISQALGFEILDAYTIRKVLPRLLLCAVAITISWPLMRFFVEFTNDLAYGIRYIIYEPFAGLKSPVLGTDGLAASSFLGLLGLNAIGIFGLLTYVGTALLAALVAYLVLVLRQILIIMCVIFAPIAIVMYILPNTQKYYKLWWESFSKALLMFAFISAMIALGRVFAALSGLNNPGLAGQLLAFAGYFIPYFLLPLSFQFAGGALRQIGGFVNDRGKGGFDRLRNARKENTANRIKRARTGGIYRDDFMQFKFRPGGKQRSVGKLANTFGNWTFDFDEQARVTAGQVPGPGRALFGRGSDIMKSEIEDQRIEHSKKAAGMLDLHYQSGRAISGQLGYFTDDLNKTEEGRAARRRMDQQFGVRDSFVRDENGEWVATEWRGVTGKNEAEEMAEILSHGGIGGRLASQELAAKAGAIGNLKINEETRRADIETVGLISAAKAGRLENEDIVARRKSQESEPGRFIDRRQQPGYGAKEMALLQDIATQKRTSQARGHGIQFDEQGRAYSVYAKPDSGEALNSVMRMSTQDIGGSKSEDLKAIADTLAYHGSQYKMTVDKTGKVDFDLDAAGNKQLKDDGTEAGKKAAAQADAVRARINTLAMYSYGDSGVGVQLKNLADRIDLKLANPSSDRMGAEQGNRPTPAPEEGAPGGPAGPA